MVNINLKVPKIAQSIPNNIFQVTKRLTFFILTITLLRIQGY